MAPTKQTDSKDNIQNKSVINTAGGILCNICNVVIERKRWFELHYIKHTLRRCDIVYTCTICRKEMSSYQTFFCHCYRVHVSKNRLNPLKFIKNETDNSKNSTIKCNICNSLSQNKEEFDIHYVQHNPQRVMYGCPDCIKETDNYQSLQHHFYNVHQRPKLKCKFCSKSVTTKTAMDSHINLVHKNRCSTCSKEFMTKAQLKLHIAQVHQNEKPPYNCMSCCETIENIHVCEEHIDLHSKPIFLCQICQEEIKDKQDFSHHIEKHFGSTFEEEVEINIEMSKGCAVDVTGGVFCYICKKLFKLNARFSEHFREVHHDNEIKYTCNICEKKFPKYKSLADHCNASHVSKNKYKCELCLKQFHRLSIFINHIQAHRNNPEDLHAPFHCFKCDTRYTNERNLLEHLKKNHGIMDLICLVKGCNQFFKSKSELTGHQTTHTVLSDHCCNTCGFAFDSPKTFIQHVQLHKQEAHSCPICGKEYGNKYCIMQHAPSHFETTLHVCKVCNKIFKEKHRLTQHTKLHSDLKCYACEVCQKSFPTQTQYRQHLDVHKELKSYSCPVCSKAFKSQSNCTTHIKRVHANYKSPEYKKADAAHTKSGDESEYNPILFTSDIVRNDHNENIGSFENHNNIYKENMLNEAFGCENLTTSSNCKYQDENCIKQKQIDKTSFVENISIKVAEEELLSNSYINIVIRKNEEQNEITENPIESTPTCNEFEETLINSVSEAQATRTILPHEYGPDFADPAMDHDHHLPHINPLLTLKKETPYVKNLFVYDFDTALEPGFANHNLKPMAEDSYSMVVDYSEW